MTHGGNLLKAAQRAGCKPHELLDFSANINPLGPPDWLREEIDAAISDIVHYPDPNCSELNAVAEEVFGVDVYRLVWGNGASQLIFSLMACLPTKRALLPVPSYIDYERALKQAGREVSYLLPVHGFGLELADLKRALPGHDLVVIGNPNNPNGSFIKEEALLEVIKDFPEVWFVIDEAFIDFVDGAPGLLNVDLPNLIVLRSATKLYCIPGLRLGFAVGPATMMAKLRLQVPPWSVNTLAQRVGVRALRDREYSSRSREYIQPLRKQLQEGLERFPQLEVVPSRANFFLVRLVGGLTVEALAEELLQRRIMIRTYANVAGIGKGIFRVAVRRADEIQQLLCGLGEILPVSGPHVQLPSPKPALMFQGTASNVGKSILSTALCRIMVQDGFRVAPFKAQNMSNNAFVTHQGGEMGRAQVLQAQAARLDPDVRMNPILLKPTGERGSQIIVNGQAMGHMDFRNYRSMRSEMLAAIHRAYDSLAAEHQVIVLEGAGSPAEVNLKRGDLVNMSMATYAAARVVLVGNIDVGGVFASLLGTMAVFTEAERARVMGYVLNRFRGDQTLLGDAYDYMSYRTGKPVLGVVPFLKDLALPQEDSVDFADGTLDDTSPLEERLDVAVVKLPHISNLSDLDALRSEPDVRLRTITSTKDIGNPHVVMLLGSKHVLNDAAFLWDTGLAETILALAGKGTEVVGLCGGLQILGERIHDPQGVEGRGTGQGLGLFPIATLFHREKTLRAISGTHGPSGETVRGYEIHHGRTEWGSLAPSFYSADGQVLGVESSSGQVWGTYLHGVFDADGFRRFWLNRVRRRLKLPLLVHQPLNWSLEPELDRLAEVVRGSIDVPAWYRQLGLK